MSVEYTKWLHDRRNKVREEQKALLDAAIEAKRDLSPEEQVTFDKMDADIVELGASVRTLEASMEEDRAIAEAFERLNTGPVTGQTDKDKERVENLRSFLKGEGQRGYDVPVEMRATQTTTNAAGVVPAGFYGQLWEYLVQTSSLLQMGPTILRTNSGETIKLPRVTAHSVAGAVTEGAAIGASDPTLGSVDSSVTKQGYLTQFTRELLDDTGVDLEGYLARSAGVALGNSVGAAGVAAAVAAASAGVTAGNGIGAVTAFGAQATAGQGYDFLISLFYSVTSPYRNSTSCGWLMSDPGASAVRKIKDSTGSYIWQPATILGQPDMILGKPVRTDSNVAAPAASVKSIVFGDWSSLTVRIAGGFRFERSDDYAFNADMTTFRALTRHGSVSVDANALKSFVHAAS